MFVTFNMAAGQRVEFREAFDFLRVMDAANPISLEFFREGREVDEANGVGTGYSEKFAQACDMVAITCGATAQAVSFATRLGSKVSYDRPPNGTVTLTKDNSNRGGVYQTAFSVGTASQVLHGADLGRAWIAISNESDTGNVWVYVDQINGAGAATQANGKKLAPGEMWEPNYCPTGNIRVISDQAATKVITFVGIY